jgi:hypothetical protein
MMRIPNLLRRGEWRDVTEHLDEATLASLLRGDAVAASGRVVAEHLAGCAACRRRMETADPLLTLFEETPVERPRAAVVAMPRAATRLVPRPHWQLSAGFAVAACAAVMLTAANQHSGSVAPHVQAQVVTDVQRITALIRTAAQKHDQVALHQALVEAGKQIAEINASHASDPALVAELATLDRTVASLPRNADTAALITGVESLIAVAPGETASAQPSPDPTVEASPTPGESALPSPEPTPSASPEPTPDPTPEPTAAPTPDPTATAQPVPEPTPSPSDNVPATATDPTPPF